MPGKRPRPTMRRTSSVSMIGSGSMNGDCSPLPEHPKEKQKPCNISSHCPAPSPPAIPPRQVIGFHPKVFIEEDHHLVLPPTSPRPQQVKSPSGSTGSPRSGLGDLLAGSRPWERRDEGVGLGIVVALGAAVPQEDCPPSGASSNNTSPTPRSRADFPPVPPYTRKMSPQHVPPFATAKTSPPIPINSPGSNSPSSHNCPSSHRYSQNCAPQFGLSSAMQESLMHDISSSSHRGVPGPSGRGAGVNHVGAISMLTTWSQQADMEVEAMTPVTPSPIAPRHHHQAPQQQQPSFLPTLSAGLNFLDACFYCKRRLGEGRDIYMYRGDRAFCSPECRHQQIVMDERPEKCSQAAMKIGGADASRYNSQRNRVVAAGTAAAA